MSGQLRLGIAGCGLLGGSLAKALRHADAVGEIIAWDNNTQALKTAKDQGVIDRSASALDTLCEADLIALAAPVDANHQLLEELAPMLGDEHVVFDLGSTKQSIVETARQFLGKSSTRFIACHPIAGDTCGGVAGARSDLFRGQRVIICSDDLTDPLALEKVRTLWQHCGAQTKTMSAAHHDRAYSLLSHLPHVLAFTLMLTLDDELNLDAMLEMGGRGFRDMSRIAGSTPEVWSAILRDNRDSVTVHIDQYIDHLIALRDVLGDPISLQEKVEQASTLRRKVDR